MSSPSSSPSPASPTPTSPATDRGRDPGSDLAELEALARTHERLLEQIEQRVIGQREVIELLLVALFAGGHALFVGVPGLAKTLLVSSLAEAMDLEFSRIQFTPDLMPSDITGSEVLEEVGDGRRSFRFVPGPVFCNLLLADEINRTPPKTQAALLQAMQESKVSAGGRTHPLPLPFHVFATQNPIEQEGTYPLPEAQLDRFMLEILVDYPDEAAERQIVAMGASERAPTSPVLSPAELTRQQDLVRRLPVPPSVIEHVVALLRATRPGEDRCPPALRELLRWGAGPRAGQQLVLAAQARAALAGREAVTKQDVRALAPAVLRHRLVPSFAAESRGVSPDELVAQVLAAVPA
ncbi:MoxR family ATPase [Pseudenhygromyxa sp. WMMC2535]|uniref:AAA family ATPase n=1 Tax=Pseudenhygromyxa sp. WMMC2535 TaxID=2712867 RepID=UPI0015552BF1|nr:MoxR family ATPase [Pseudenhygromyxa sp. WMMC2535]